ncbi:ribokinase [Kistimonas asteriae]|uniref:ribokinase n=1 Tax=Kistimonas asteriae TaxID=517724 RepID=UPI001BAC18E6|nr:ribokinase [Kistimonas asteriae]
MSSKKILVLGSVNADHLVRVPRLPKPGETVAGKDYEVIPGGKGANQAVACARLGGQTAFIACVGDDAFGTDMIQRFQADGIDTQAVCQIADQTTGVALICVDNQAENCIVIAPGANAKLTTSRVQAQHALIADSDYLLMQLETPLDGLLEAVEIAHNADVKVVLNPAPAKALPDELLLRIDMITPNQTEAELLTGIPVNDVVGAAEAAGKLHAMGITTVVITLSSQGVWISEKGNGRLVEGYSVTPVDTTAAGDTFNGAMLVALAQGESLDKAANFANAAAALSVTRHGAQPSIPSREDVEQLVADNQR